MKPSAIVCLILFGLFAQGCGRGEGDDATESVAVDTMAVLTSHIQECSRIYTTEFQVHKIVTCETKRTIGGMGLSIGLDLFGQRKVLIPLEATLKGYVDLSGFTAENIERKGSRIIITLPDPEVMMTATRIDHEGIKHYVTGFRHNFTDAELAALEAQGRQAIIDEIPTMGIERAARVSAARLLIPLFAQMGFDKADITISFRKDFTPDVLQRKLE